MIINILKWEGSTSSLHIITELWWWLLNAGVFCSLSASCFVPAWFYLQAGMLMVSAVTWGSLVGPFHTWIGSTARQEHGDDAVPREG